MTRILRTTQALPKEALTFETPTGHDGQGRPVYDSPIEFDANVLEYATSRAGAEFVVLPDGSQVRAPLTLYVQGDQANVPGEGARVTLPDSRTFIVVEKKPVSGLLYTRAEADHYRLRCKLES